MTLAAKIALVVALLSLAPSTLHAQISIENLVGTWRSTCQLRSAQSSHSLITTTTYLRSGKVSTTVALYADDECKEVREGALFLTGQYRLGEFVTTLDGDLARELDIQIEEMRLDDSELQIQEKKHQQIVVITDGQMYLGTLPTEPTNGPLTRPQTLNKTYFLTRRAPSVSPMPNSSKQKQ